MLKVLILDEGTANLDAENEAKILDTVKSLDITRIAVVHRPATLEAAQKLYQIKGGWLSFRPSSKGVARSSDVKSKLQKI